mmetsp:Transcript_14607/g.27410  ORF Transcript_14607/g.27410 Transcript_14607/m.27410 type:complete len:101 (+) Transcript_14607:1367-1669(+)
MNLPVAVADAWETPSPTKVCNTGRRSSAWLGGDARCDRKHPIPLGGLLEGRSSKKNAEVDPLSQSIPSSLQDNGCHENCRSYVDLCSNLRRAMAAKIRNF